MDCGNRAGIVTLPQADAGACGGTVAAIFPCTAHMLTA